MTGIIDDVDGIGARLKELEAAKASLMASPEYVSIENAEVAAVSDEDRLKFFGMYGWGYQAPKEDAA